VASPAGLGVAAAAASGAVRDPGARAIRAANIRADPWRWCGGWVWRAGVGPPRKQGPQGLFALTLTGLGERSHLFEQGHQPRHPCHGHSQRHEMGETPTMFAWSPGLMAAFPVQELSRKIGGNVLFDRLA